MNPDPPEGYLLELEKLRNRALGVNPIKLLQVISGCRGEVPAAPSENRGLTDRLLDGLGRFARSRVSRREGGADKLYEEAVKVKSGHCPFCRQRFSVLEFDEEGFCGDCKTAGVTEKDYWEMIFYFRKLRELREADDGGGQHGR